MRQATFSNAASAGIARRSSSTDLRNRLLLHMASRRRGAGRLSAGFTLIELMIVIVIVGILSAVAIPQFLNQTKKAVATEGTTQASAILKQAAAYHLETPITTATIDADCSDYAGTIPTVGVKFTYACSGSETAFLVTATGVATTNAKDIKVEAEGDLTTGAVKKPVITGI